MSNLIRVERFQRLRKEEDKRAQFMKDPYKFTKTLLGEARSMGLTSLKEVVEGFLKESHSDTFGGQALRAHLTRTEGRL